ncbi:MAG: hypothetical protein FJ267_03535, partial [Planctomycetes bacterium]|nr:hypothetical protein [Planctomycetota bacterium]
MILYEVLTLNRPFNSVSPMDVGWRIVNCPPTSPRSIRRDIPVDLASICLKCLEKNPGSRYPSAAALRDDLRNFLQGRPVQARQPTLFEKSWKWARRNPIVALLSCVVFLISSGWIMAAVSNAWTIATMDLELRQITSFAKRQEEQAQVSDLAASVNSYDFQTRLANELCQNEQYRLMADVLSKCRPVGQQKDLREFCWKYLWRIAKSDRDFSIGKYSVRRLALSGHGRVLTGICMDRTVRAWDVETGEVLCSQSDFVYEPSAVAVSDDGKFIAASSAGPCEWCGEVRVWETETNRLVRELRGIGVSEGAICFLPKTTKLAIPLRRLAFDRQLPKYLP